jgi:hypothetical protein
MSSGSPELQLYTWTIMGATTILGTIIFSYWIITSILLEAEKSRLKSKLLGEADMHLLEEGGATLSAVYNTNLVKE